MGGGTSKDDCIEAGFFQDNNKYGNVDTGMKVFDFHGKGLFTFVLGMFFGASMVLATIVIRNRLCPYTHRANGRTRGKQRFANESDDDDIYDIDALERRHRRRRSRWHNGHAHDLDFPTFNMPPHYARPAIWAPARFTDITHQPETLTRTTHQTTSQPPDPSIPPPALNGATAT